MPGSQYVITNAYGRTFESMRAAEQAFIEARAARDYTEAARCMEEIDQWRDLLDQVPRFTHEYGGGDAVTGIVGGVPDAVGGVL